MAGAHPGAALLSGRMIAIDPTRALSFVAGVNEPDSGAAATPGMTGVHAEGLPLGDEAIGPGCRTVGKARLAMAGDWPLVGTRAGLFLCSTCPSEKSRLPLNRCISSVQRKA